MKIEHEQSCLKVGRGDRGAGKLVNLSLTRKHDAMRVEINLTPAEARVVATMLAETARELK